MADLYALLLLFSPIIGPVGLFFFFVFIFGIGTVNYDGRGR